MALKEKFYRAELRRIVRGSDWLMGILEAVRDCEPPDWLAGGGVLYKLVWNRLHGYEETRYVGDVDVVFFDPEDLSPERERAVERALLARRADVLWEAKTRQPFISGTRRSSATGCLHCARARKVSEPIREPQRRWASVFWPTMISTSPRPRA